MLNLDDKLTIFFNSYHSAFWDDFFFVFSGQLFWLPLAVSIIYAIYKSYGRKIYLPLLFVFLIILFADQISSSIFKPLFERLRPSHDPRLEGLICNVHGYKGGLYGFVSSHAANSVAFALFSALLFKNRIFTFLITTWAVLTAYSRIYLGVHFLGDVLAGSCIGFLVAWSLYKLFVYLINKRNIRPIPMSKTAVLVVASTFMLSILVLLLFSSELLFMA